MSDKYNYNTIDELYMLDLSIKMVEQTKVILKSIIDSPHGIYTIGANDVERYCI